MDQTMRKTHRPNPISILENLEPRTLFSESASAQPVLVSTTGSGPSTTYNYNITLKDTGTTALGTFWFGWVPGEDFLKSMPTAISDPTGWQHIVTGGSPGDGFAIQWTATGAGMSAGQSLSGFKFSSADSPTVLAGNSAAHPTSPAETSFVYIGAPFNDPGFQFVGLPPTVTTSASLVVTPPAAQIATAGVSKSFSLGSFKATGATAPYTVDVNWGDGSADTKFTVTTPGTIPAKSHTFAKAAKDTVSIIVTDSAKHTSNKATFAVTVAPPTGSISGEVFGDTNADGKIDDNELGLGLWTVYIDTNNDGKLESTEKFVTTNINGQWTFTGLTAGKYVIRVVPVTGAVATKPTGGVLTITLAAGQKSTGNLFGERAVV
jgi:uncharacterized protein (DUF2141 family)